MPKYKKDVKKEITQKEVEVLISRCSQPDHQVAIALLYLTGARPSEMVKLAKEDFISPGDGTLRIHIVTTKKGYERGLIMDIDTTPFVKSLIIPYIIALPEKSPVFGFRTPDRLKHIIYAVSGNTLTPYSFRHNRMFRLAEAGADPFELMAWKGGKKLDSIIPYVMRSGWMIAKLKSKIK